MRAEPSVLHLDLDAFFASVEQRDKPSLRGKPVIVGGIGPRGVVSTASYQAREYGVRSAMRMTEARARCPNAAYLAPRFAVYRQVARAVRRVLRELSPRIEAPSLDEAYVDLAAGAGLDLTVSGVERIARELKARVHAVTGGLTASVGVGTSKLIAKIASDLDKPDGLVVIPPGGERDLLYPMPVSAIPGVGPATAERLRKSGVHTIAQLDALGEAELVRTLGQAHGSTLARLAHGEDDRPVESEVKSRSVSVEDTFDRDIADADQLRLFVERMAARVAERLRRSRLSGRTITLKYRLFDFTTHTRSATLPGPTDDPRVITRLARRLLDEADTTAGVRLLGVGVSGLADWVQDDLFQSRLFQSGAADAAETDDERTERASAEHPDGAAPPRWSPGADVVHAEHGRGWVWGSGLGRVTVRFETAETAPGPIRTFVVDDPRLAPYTPLWIGPDPASTEPDPAFWEA